MKLTLLGTGNAMVTRCYNTCFLLEDEGKYMLVDAGGGNTILSRLAQAGADWQDVRDIFVTHKHIDHIMGIIWLIRKVCQGSKEGTYKGEARIYAHEEVAEILRYMTEALLPAKIAARLKTETLEEYLEARKTGRAEEDGMRLIIVEDGQSCDIIGHPVTFFDIHSTKAKQFGFSFDLGDGQKLTCCGDEPYNELEKQYAENSKWLMLEAFCLYGQADIFHPYEKHHSTVKEACELAQTLNVPNLILYHTEEKNLDHRKQLYTEEGKQYYTGNLYVPEDLESFEL